MSFFKRKLLKLLKCVNEIENLSDQYLGDVGKIDRILSSKNVRNVGTLAENPAQYIVLTPTVYISAGVGYTISNTRSPYLGSQLLLQSH